MKKLIFMLFIIFCQFTFGQNKGVVVLKCRMIEKPLSFRLVQKLEKGDTLSIIDKKGNYYFSEFHHKKGYVSQENIKIIGNKSKYKLLEDNPPIDDEMKYIRYCLGKYGQEKMSSHLLELSGIGLGVVGAFTEKKEFYAVGGIFALFGFVIDINSEKWMKRAYLGPDGVGVKFNF
jgi:hypothetical protein